MADKLCDDHGKQLVHDLTNHLQVVLGFLELGQHQKALTAAQEAAKKCRAIVKHCSDPHPVKSWETNHSQKISKKVTSIQRHN